jgi:predicted lipid-binding transport protein (Tim44 family)
MKNKKGQFRDLGDIFKAVITGIIGIIFLSGLTSIVSQDLVTGFVSLGIFLIVAAVIITVISFVARFFNPRSFM